jgi:hypothetical protein
MKQKYGVKLVSYSGQETNMWCQGTEMTPSEGFLDDGRAGFDDTPPAVELMKEYEDRNPKGHYVVEPFEVPSEEFVCFHNVRISIPVASPQEAYKALCNAIAKIPGVEWETDTYSTHDDEETRSTSKLIHRIDQEGASPGDVLRGIEDVFR